MIPCAYLSCTKPATIRGYCKQHYNILYLRGEIKKLVRIKPTVCSKEGCGRKVFRTDLCFTHYTRKRKGITKDEIRSRYAQETDFYKLEATDLEIEESTLREQLYRARCRYQDCYGIQERLFWKHQIEKQAADLKRLLDYKGSVKSEVSNETTRA